MRIGQTVKSKRAALDWTQSRLADEIKARTGRSYTVQAVSQLEQDKIGPSEAVLRALVCIFREHGQPFDPAVEVFLGIEPVEKQAAST